MEHANSAEKGSDSSNLTEPISQLDIVDDSNSCNSFSYDNTFTNTGGECLEQPNGNTSDVSVSNGTRTSKRLVNTATTLKKLSNEKFMENFDPERSNRERRKLNRKISNRGGKKTTLYDEKGLMGSADFDLCDCLEEDCPGCHFPCPKCHSNKCGHECRQFRRWMYEEIVIEGTNVVITNPRLLQSRPMPPESNENEEHFINEEQDIPVITLDSD